MKRDPRERARAGLDEALSRQVQARSLAEGRGAEPWPGDLFVLAATAGRPVEWLLVERSREGRCRLVAADTHPSLGCADLALPPEAPAGPLSLRCAVEIEVAVETLRRAERTGALAPEDLDRVRRRREELAAGAFEYPRLGAGGEPDPEYEDWLDEVLLPARAALAPALQEEPARSRRGRWIGFPGALAVALFLALCGVSVLAWRYHQGEGQAWTEVHRLEASRHKTEAEQQRQLEAERQRLAAAEARHAEELRAARQAPNPSPPSRGARLPLKNLTYASLYPGESRGTVRELVAPPQTTHLFLVLYVGQQSPFQEYRLEVVSRASGVTALTVDELRPLPRQEVSVVLPRVQLPDGTYLLRLYGLRGKERHEVAHYELRIRSGGGTSDR
jgi:hypothetical protein